MNIWKVREGTPKSCNSDFWGRGAGSWSWCLCTKSRVPAGWDPDPKDGVPASHRPWAAAGWSGLCARWRNYKLDSAAASGKIGRIVAQGAASCRQEAETKWVPSLSSPFLSASSTLSWWSPLVPASQSRLWRMFLDLWFMAKVYGHRQNLPHWHLFIQPPSTRFSHIWASI